MYHTCTSTSTSVNKVLYNVAYILTKTKKSVRKVLQFCGCKKYKNGQQLSIFYDGSIKNRGGYKKKAFEAKNMDMLKKLKSKIMSLLT